MLLNKKQLQTPFAFSLFLSSVRLSQGHIAKIIQNLDPNKAHGHDNISIRMLKTCGSFYYILQTSRNDIQAMH